MAPEAFCTSSSVAWISGLEFALTDTFSGGLLA
jgi:hypothetical protein